MLAISKQQTMLKLIVLTTIGCYFSVSFAQDSTEQTNPPEAIDSLELIESDNSSEQIGSENNIDETVENSELTDQQTADIILSEEPDLQQGSFDRSVIEAINSKQQQLFEVLETEDAFSLKLAEVYSEYGSLLLRSRRFDEAHEVYQQALHIEKVNGGIYAIEQLSALNSLIQIAIATNQEEDVDAYLTRVSLIRNNNGEINSPHLNELYLNSGHYYFELYNEVKNNYALAIEYLRKSRRFLEFYLSRSQEQPLSSRSLPYRELVLISFYEGSIISGLPFGSSVQSSLSLSDQTKQLEARREYVYLSGSYDRGMDHLNKYLRKAKAEDNGSEIIKAFLAAADLSILFGQYRFSNEFYKSAWINIEKYGLQDQYLAQLANPQVIPPFDYINSDKGLLDHRQTGNGFEPSTDDQVNVLSIQLSFSISPEGVISNVRAVDDEQSRYFARARRALRRLQFRPAIVDGDRVALEEYTYPIEIAVN